MSHKIGSDFFCTTHRVLTRRGVLWLGQTCNLRCHFCYFQGRVAARDHPDHPFMALEKAKRICTVLRETYDNLAVDIQGGEPTIYPEIEALTAYCAEIGLRPSLITNALVLDSRQRVRGLKLAGVRDLLVSVHGLGDIYEAMSGVPGSHRRQMRALDNLVAEGVPFRFNCVLAKSALPQLVEVAALARESGARVVNFIAFNPFEDQQDNRRTDRDVPRYAEVTGPLLEAMDLLREAGIEVNVRYYPLCMVPEDYREHLYNFQQLPYDLHEWDYASWSWTAEPSQRRRDGDLTPVLTLRQANTRSRLFGHEGYLDDTAVSREDEYRHSALIRAREHCGYRFDATCEHCSLLNICDGIHGDYVSLFGASEAQAVRLEQVVADPMHYIQRQSKIVEREDAPWAIEREGLA